MQEKTPQILYKYRSLETIFTKPILTEGQLYFSTTKELNDPLEKFFTLPKDEWMTLSPHQLQQCESFGITPAQVKKLPNHNTLRILFDRENAAKYLRHKIIEKEVHGILSLSASKNSTHMHTYYADGFKGICIGFDWDKFGLLSDDNKKIVPTKIKYRDAPLEIKKTPEEWFEVLTTKSSDFEPEKEYRMFYKKGCAPNTHRNRIRGAIKEIIFGHLVSKEKQDEVKKWVSDLTGIDFFITQSVIGTYEFEISSL